MKHAVNILGSLRPLLQKLGIGLISLFLTATAQAGVTIHLELDHNHQGDSSDYYLAFVWLQTNALSEPLPDTGYFVWSASSAPMSDLFADLNPDLSNPFNGKFFADYPTLLNEVTNTWNLMVTNLTSTNFYTFTFSEFSSNAIGQVAVNFPADGSVDITNRPTFLWQDPSGYEVGPTVVEESPTASFYQQDNPGLGVGQWPSPYFLTFGSNYIFYATYASNATALVQTTTPTDTVHFLTIADWDSTCTINTESTAAFSITNPFASIPSDIHGHSCVLHYSFDDSNLFTQDLSGHDNGTSYSWFSNPPYITNDAAAGPFAMGSDGSGWLSPTTNVLSTLAGSFTVSLWINPAVLKGNDNDDEFSAVGLVSAANFSGEDVMPLGLTGSKLIFYTGGNTTDLLRSQASIVPGQYVQVACTRNIHTGEKRLYINGVLDTNDFGTTELLNGTDDLAVGENNFNVFQGDLDEVEIYEGVLTDAEIAALYQNPGGAAPDAPDLNPDISFLVAHYTFDDSQPGPDHFGHDSSGNGNDINAGGAFDFGNGAFFDGNAISGDGAANFDGGSFLSFSPTPGDLLTTLAGSFSISLWVETSQDVDYQGDYAFAGACLVSADVGGLANDLVPVALTGGAVAFNTGGDFDDTLTSGATVNDGNYHHIVVTRDQPTGVKQIFIDGVLDTSSQGTTNLLNDPQLLTLGAIQDASYSDPAAAGANNGYEGLVDEIQIYRGVLTPSQVNYLFDNPNATITNADANPLGFAVNAPELAWTTGGAMPWFEEASQTHDGIAAAQSGDIADQQESWIETQVAGPGTINFWWLVNYGDGNNALDFVVDGNVYDSLYGYDWNWEPDSFPLPPGNHFLQWRYSKNGSTSTGDPGFLDEVSFTNVVAPVITDGPSTQPGNNLETGTTLTLVTHLYANPPATIWWLKNGALVPGATDSTLIITNLQLSDAGNYQMVASNYLGAAYSPLAFVSIYQPTDLQPLSLTLPPVVTSQTLTPLVWSVTNTGPATVSGYYDGILIRDTNGNVVNSVAEFIGLFGFKALPATTYTMSNYQRFPGIPAGNYTVELQADEFNAVIETDESNNVLAGIPITVINPDLQPGNMQIAQTNRGGTTVQLTFNLTNNGPGIMDGATFEDELYISTSPVYDGNAVGILQINQAPHLGAGEFMTVTNQVSLPVEPSGNYYLILRIDAFGSQPNGEITEVNESNNIISTPIHLNESDLVPTNVVTPPIVSAREPIQVQWSDLNQGDGVATKFNPFLFYEWVDRFYLSTNQQINPSSIVMGQFFSDLYDTTSFYESVDFQNTTPLASGATLPAALSLDVPNLAAGHYFLILSVDADHAVTEGNETNNLSIQPLQVLDVDLAPVTVTAPPAGSAQSSIQVSWSVTNLGAGAVYPKWIDNIYLSTQPTFDSTAMLLGSLLISNRVDAGSNYMATNVVTLPGVAAGHYYVIVRVDAATNLIENTRANNYISTPLDVGSPDFAATSLAAPAIASSQEPISLVYVVSNRSGVIALPGWSDRVYFSTNSFVDTNAVPLADLQWSGSIPVGSSYTNLANVTVPGAPAGDYFILVEADQNDFFTEANTANNVVSSPIHILNPDLIPTNFNAPSSVVIQQLNQQISLDWTVLNRGAGAAYQSWFDSVYISPTNVLDSNAVFLTGAGVAPVLGAGAPYLGFNNAPVPNGIEGNYYLLLNANDNANLYEANRTNNLLVRPFQITVPPYPILAVVSLQAPTEAWSGQPITVTWTLTNSGAGAIDGSFYDTVYLASSPAGDNLQPYNNFQFTGRIEPGQSIVRQQLINLPLSLSGTFWPAVQADVNHNIFEFTNAGPALVVASQPLVVHLTPTPNLQVTSVQGPTSIFSSAPATISWVVTNSGAGPTRAPFWNDNVYLSASTNMFDPHYFAYLGAAQNTAFLDSGESYANSLNVTIPRGIDGTYYFLVRADDGNYVFEGDNEGDNVLASAPVVVNLTPPPDLQVTALIAPLHGFSGQPISVQWAVTNLGLGQTTATETGWYDRVYISTNNFLDFHAVSLGDFLHNGGLDPTMGYSATNNVTLPIGISGNWYVIVQCDIFNSVFEGAFEDNDFTIASHATVVELTPPPDLQAQIVAAPTNALSSHTLSVTYSVANNGSTVTPNSGWYDGLYLSTNSVFDSTATFFNYVGHSGALPPGASYTNTLSALLPDTYTGTNYIYVVSDLYTEVFELNKSNNVAVAPMPVVIVSRPANLAAISLQGPASANIGSGILVSWTVTNLGAGDTAVASWNDRVILAQNTVPGGSSDIDLLDYQHSGIVGVGGQYNVANALAEIPNAVAPGNYYLIVIADDNTTVYEGTNINHSVSAPRPITITAHSADLQVTAAAGPTNAPAGSYVTVNYTVKNGGDLPPASSYWLDYLYLSPDGALGPNTIFLGYVQNLAALAPGASYANSITAALPPNIQSNYTFVVYADANNYISEPPGLRFNNVYQVTPPVFITPSALPDLVVTNVIVPPTAYEGQSFTVTWTVENIGNATAANIYWYDVAYLSLDQSLDAASDTYLGYEYHPRDLAPGQSYTNTAQFVIPEGLAGPFYVFISADFDHTIYEGDLRDNNTQRAPEAMQIQLLPPVDLVAGPITVPANASPGQSMSISYIVSNEGANPALGSWQDSLFISSDTNWDINDKLFATVQHKGDVAPNSSYTNGATAPLPGLLPGDYYVIVRSDILNHLIEANKSNNVAASLDSVSTDVPRLTLGVPATGMIAQNQSVYYSFDATNGETIHIQFTTGAGLADNELFVRGGQMPTTGDFDYAANNPFVSDPEIFIPITNSGTYYVLADSQYLAGVSNYTILAAALPFTVSEVQPTYGGNQGSTTFEVRGALFDSQTHFQLVNGAITNPAQNVLLDDSSTAYVTFNLIGDTNGFWDLQAIMGTNSVAVTTLSNAVNVFPGQGAILDVAVDGPLAVSEPSMGLVPHGALVDYGNSGDSDAVAPLIMVSGEGGTIIGTQINVLRSQRIEFLGRSLTGPPNIIRPQISQSIQIFYEGESHDVEVWAIAADSVRAMNDSDWVDIEATVRPGGVADADWQPFWANIRDRVGGTWGDYVQFLDRTAANLPPEMRNVSQIIGALFTNSPDYRASSSLSGSLVGAQDGLPKPGVEIDLYTVAANSQLSTVAASAITDTYGEFAFTRVPPGSYYAYITNQFFDMNQDGKVDGAAPTYTISNNDLSKQTIYLYQQPPLTNLVNDSDAQLQLDSQGALHAFWLRDSVLWHAWDKGGQWVDAAPLSTNKTPGSFAVGSSPHLLDRTTAGLIAVWSEDLTNGVELVYAVGRSASGGGYEWSQPAALTHDLVRNFSPGIAIGANGLAVITYLKIGIGQVDDSDVYYSVVDLKSGDLVWSSPAPTAAPQAGESGFDSTDNSFSTTWKNDFKFPIGNDEASFGYNFSLKGSKSGCGASATGSAGVQAAYNGSSTGVSGGGSLSMTYNWQVNPDICEMDFKNASASASANLHVDFKNLAARILQSFTAIPPAVAFGAGIDRMTDWLRARRPGFLLENSIGIGVGLSLEGVKWDRAPGPITSWRAPDEPGQTFLTLDCTLSIGGRFLGANESQINAVDWSGKPYTAIESTESPYVNPTFNVAGQAKATVKFKVYPVLSLKEYSLVGTLKVSIAPFFSYTLPTLGAPVIVDPTARPKDGSDPLPAGWTFSYDPGAFVGSTNTYGTNSVLKNVASDLYQDGAPSLAVDGGGVPFQAWYKSGDPRSGQPGSQVFVADFNGTNWNDPVIIPDSVGLNSYVSAAADAAGNRLVVWVHTDASSLTTNSSYDDLDAVRGASEVTYSTFDGTAWSEPQTLAATPGADQNVQLSRLPNGDVMALWSYGDSNGVSHLLFSTWNGAAWTKPSEITSGTITTASAQQAGSTIYVLWTQEVNANHDTAIFQSTFSGSGWSAPALFAPTNTTPIVVANVIEPKDTANSLANLSSLSQAEIDACCKCAGKLTVAKGPTYDPNKHCGRASPEYDYTNCTQKFVYIPCGIRPVDPNNIIGPVGFGPDQWVSASAPLDYSIQFENDPTKASAPARQVTITLPLDPNLDPRSFRLGNFGWGGMIFNVPPNTAFYQTRLDFTATNGFYVDVFAGVDVANRQAFWILSTIDPNTGDVPANPLIGFLPPDNPAPQGEGFVSYVVNANSDVANGARVNAQAVIVFDNQSPLPTPSIYNTLEAGAPSSAVAALPPVVNPVFGVSWAGATVAGGPGVASYDIYVSQDSQSYYLWLQNTTLTQSPFSGQPGSTYDFYSIAHDNSGATQPTPLAPNASTIVSTNVAPALDPIPNVVVAPNQPAAFTARATDANGDQITYSLAAGNPAGSSIDPATGVFLWRPSRSLAETTNLITVVATDNGLPPLTASQSFLVTVLDYLEMTLGVTNVEGGHSASLPVNVSSSSGVTNLTFSVQVPPNVLTNFALDSLAPSVGSATVQTQGTNLLIAISTLPGQSLQGSNVASQLTFSALPNSRSSFVALPVTNAIAAKPDGSAYVNYITPAGLVMVVNDEPLLTGSFTAPNRTLTLFGKLGANYQIQYKTNLGNASWQPWLSYTQTNGVITIDIDSTDEVIFYRLLQQ
ncbi:MAG TPA: CARDB domain-containing protein [Verrucomicrobiae bacterium]|jgi:hypothetical protein|nr:CARDB domain-containing protein [Verrucomicrobiae bacterium]